MSKKKSAHKVTENLQVQGFAFTGKTEGQNRALESMRKNQVTVLYGMAGTGKSYLATALGLQQLMQDKCEKLILTRPYVEAGEKLGFLPGDFNMKIAPFVQPLMDVIGKFTSRQMIMQFIEKGNIQVIPMAYMRGITFENSFVVADECQNASCHQMRMLLTRVGPNSKLVITGDTDQSDLFPRGDLNGLQDVINRFNGTVPEIAFHELTEDDCVRSPFVAKIEKLYRNKK